MFYGQRTWSQRDGVPMHWSRASYESGPRGWSSSSSPISSASRKSPRGPWGVITRAEEPRLDPYFERDPGRGPQALPRGLRGLAPLRRRYGRVRPRVAAPSHCGACPPALTSGLGARVSGAGGPDSIVFFLRSWCGSGDEPLRCRNGARPAVRAQGGPYWGVRVCRLPPRWARRIGGTRRPTRP